ncbi:DUF3291 domain-containing protein [Streptomyces sp. NPDC006372]|uniref:DUF3291 domain-containing protein n=1 Tax=Streptomyces sp. NPDC006372 TaxID=3155599 RepID=UPI0033ACF165
MPTLPWTVPDNPPRDTEVHVFATRFETRTLWGALKFLVGTPAVWRQVRNSPGAYGVTLKAKPLRRMFWTLSAWESKAALDDFVRAGAHKSAARGVASQMRDKASTTWQVRSDDLPLSWSEAFRRLP